jgi:urease accessory protein
VRGGDVLVAEDGSLIKVIAAPQPVLVITHCSEHGTPFDLMRAAYHLGNRHVPIELRPDHLKIEPDHVLAEMLRSMHLIVSAQDAAFEPEGGAYGSHAAPHSHSHAPAPAKPKGFRPWAPELMPDEPPAPAHDHDHPHPH